MRHSTRTNHRRLTATASRAKSISCSLGQRQRFDVYRRNVAVAALIARSAGFRWSEQRLRIVSLLIGATAVAGVLALLFGPGLHAAEVVVGVAVGVMLVMWAARKPGGALGVIIVYVPLQTVLLAWMYHVGAPDGLVRNLGFLKEAMT